MKCSDRNQLENISSFIDFVALLIELHIWRNDIKYSSFQDASIDIKISPFEWSLELHIKCAFSFGAIFPLKRQYKYLVGLTEDNHTIWSLHKDESTNKTVFNN
jgi:hypothetical protein